MHLKLRAPAPDRYTLPLLADGRLTARFDCNRGLGAYRIAAGRMPGSRRGYD
jgi:hypothetical protein